MKIAVVCGGQSAERDVSLRSGTAVATALKQTGHEVVILDTSAENSALRDCDIVFPVLHGVGGEDGEFQGRLDDIGVAYVGSGSDSSRLCMNKDSYRAYMIAAGFLMAEGATVTKDEYFSHPIASGPHVLKPVDGGSSVDTIIIRGERDRYENTILDVFGRYDHLILERLITGIELTVGVLDQRSLPVIEIIPPTDGEFDYENKYNGTTQELIPPIHVDETIQAKVQDIALRAHNAAGCRDFSRSDIIVTDEGQCFLLETNTIPGLTDQSLFPKMTQAIGLDMSALCDMLVGFAAARKQ